MLVRYWSGRGRTRISRHVPAVLLGLIIVQASFCQQPAANVVPENKRILWIIPNYRTSPTLANYKPLTTGGKFKLAAKDAFDPGTFVLAGLSSGGLSIGVSNLLKK